MSSVAIGLAGRGRKDTADPVRDGAGQPTERSECEISSDKKASQPPATCVHAEARTASLAPDQAQGPSPRDL